MRLTFFMVQVLGFSDVIKSYVLYYFSMQPFGFLMHPPY